MQKRYLILGVFLIVWAIFFITDFVLAQNNKAPVFGVRTSILKDGGTKEYYGLGYKVIKYNKLDVIDQECLDYYYEYIGYTDDDRNLVDISDSGCVTAGRKDAVFGTWFLKVE